MEEPWSQEPLTDNPDQPWPMEPLVDSLDDLIDGIYEDNDFQVQLDSAVLPTCSDKDWRFSGSRELSMTPPRNIGSKRFPTSESRDADLQQTQPCGVPLGFMESQDAPRFVSPEDTPATTSDVGTLGEPARCHRPTGQISSGEGDELESSPRASSKSLSESHRGANCHVSSPPAPGNLRSRISQAQISATLMGRVPDKVSDQLLDAEPKRTISDAEEISLRREAEANGGEKEAACLVSQSKLERAAEREGKGAEGTGVTSIEGSEERERCSGHGVETIVRLGSDEKGEEMGKGDGAWREDERGLESGQNAEGTPSDFDADLEVIVEVTLPFDLLPPTSPTSSPHKCPLLTIAATIESPARRKAPPPNLSGAALRNVLPVPDTAKATCPPTVNGNLSLPTTPSGPPSRSCRLDKRGAPSPGKPPSVELSGKDDAEIRRLYPRTLRDVVWHHSGESGRSGLGRLEELLRAMDWSPCRKRRRMEPL